MQTMDRTIAGKRIKYYRTRAGLSQRDLAALSGLSHGSLWKIETGKTTPRPSTIRRLGVALGVGEAALLSVNENSSSLREATRDLRKRLESLEEVEKLLGQALDGLATSIEEIEVRI